jgi:hypothetical protein
VRIGRLWLRRGNAREGSRVLRAVNRRAGRCGMTNRKSLTLDSEKGNHFWTLSCISRLNEVEVCFCR